MQRTPGLLYSYERSVDSNGAVSEKIQVQVSSHSIRLFVLTFIFLLSIAIGISPEPLINILSTLKPNW